MKKRTAAGAAAAGATALTIAIGVIKPWEGLSLRAYPDIVGVMTICYGETKGVKPGMVKTPAECETMLARRVKEFQTALRGCLTRPLPAKTEAAFVSWSYNVGTGAACESTLVRLANAGNLRGACDELMKWTRAGGRIVKGLVNRREAERKLCLAGLGDPLPPPPPAIDTPPPELQPKPAPAPKPPEAIKPPAAPLPDSPWPYLAAILALLTAIGGVIVWRRRR